jgi:hypothetical protein
MGDIEGGCPSELLPRKTASEIGYSKGKSEKHDI